MNAALKTRFLRSMDRLQPEYVGVLQELVRTPSPVGSEGPAQQIVERQMRRLGLDVDAFDIDPARLSSHAAFVDDGRATRGRPNVVGVRRGAGGGRSLLLNAHVDCAPVDPAGVWERDPHSGSIEDGKLFGAGAWDDKAGCAQMLWIAAALADAGIRLRGDLTLMSVIEDEMTGNGTLACVDRGYLADGAVVLDGTWRNTIIHEHMGQLMFRVSIEGDPVAAVGCGFGVNPVHAAMEIIREFGSFVKRENDALAAPWGQAKRPVFINIGRIEAGAWPGSVPARCTLEGQYGFLPPDTVEVARRRILDCVGRATPGSTWMKEHPPRVEFFGYANDPFQGDAGNGVVRGLRDTARELWNHDVVSVPITGCCDLRHLRRPGADGEIPACLYGPGDGFNAHEPNEYIVIEAMEKVAKTVGCFLMNWSGVVEE